MVNPVKIDPLSKIHVEAAYTTGERDVQEAISEFASSRNWSIFFGVVTGLSLGACIFTVTTFAISPALSTHIWTVVGVGTVINGIGIALFAITTVQAVKDHRKKDNLLTGFKEYSLLNFAHGILVESLDYSKDDRHNFVLGIQNEDMGNFLGYLDESVLGKLIPQSSILVSIPLQNRIHDLADFIRARPDWEGELANAGFDENLLMRLEACVVPLVEKE